MLYSVARLLLLASCVSLSQAATSNAAHAAKPEDVAASFNGPHPSQGHRAQIDKNRAHLRLMADKVKSVGHSHGEKNRKHAQKVLSLYTASFTACEHADSPNTIIDLMDTSPNAAHEFVQACAAKGLTITVVHELSFGVVIISHANADLLATIMHDEKVKEVEADCPVDALLPMAPRPKDLRLIDYDNPGNWGLKRIDEETLADEDDVFTIAGDGSGVNIYVLDTGTLQSHNEFKNPDGSSRVKGSADVAGYGDGLIDHACHAHGTHCAGITGGNKFGVAKGATIVAIQVLSCTGSGSSSGVLAGVNWAKEDAVAKNVRGVLSMSLGGGAPSTAAQTAYNSVFEAGLITVAAAGNGGNSAYSYPASYENVISVGATDSNDNRAGFSQVNDMVDIYAPGVNIMSAVLGTDASEQEYSGTSMATPYVAGAAAVLFQLHPDLTATEAFRALQWCQTNAPPNPDIAPFLQVQNLGSGDVATCDAPTVAPTSAPSPPPPLGPCTMYVDILTDNYGSETAWTLKDSSGALFASKSTSDYPASNTQYNTYVGDLESGETYEFHITDSYGDGICCSYGQGGYTVSLGGVPQFSGGDYGQEEKKDVGPCSSGGTSAPTSSAPVTSPTSAPSALPSSPTSPTPPDNSELLCYAKNYGHLHTGYCKGMDSMCNYGGLLWHWNTHGIVKNKSKECDTDTASMTCYANNYANIKSAYCSSGTCNRDGLQWHWDHKGQIEGKSKLCSGNTATKLLKKPKNENKALLPAH
jgi:subtilisin family serine protease